MFWSRVKQNDKVRHRQISWQCVVWFVKRSIKELPFAPRSTLAEHLKQQKMKQSAAIDLAQLFSNDQGICENGTQEETFPAAMNMMNKLYIYMHPKIDYVFSTTRKIELVRPSLIPTIQQAGPTQKRQPGRSAWCDCCICKHPGSTLEHSKVCYTSGQANQANATKTVRNS